MKSRECVTSQPSILWPRFAASAVETVAALKMMAGRKTVLSKVSVRNALLTPAACKA